MDERVGLHGRRADAAARRPPQPQADDAGRARDGVDLVWLFKGVLRRWGVIARFVAAGLALAALYLVLATPRYSATASLLLDAPQPKILNVESVLLGRESDQYFVESQLEILQSPRILRRAVELMRTRNRSAEGGGGAGGAAEPQAKEEDVFDAAEVLKRNLKVERKGRSFLIEITYRDPDPARAKIGANAVVDAYIADQLDTKVQAAHTVNAWLKARLDELKLDLEQTEQRIQAYRADKDLVDVGDQTLAQKQIADHALALANARARAAEAEARLAQVHTQTNEIERDTLSQQVKLLEDGLEGLKQRMLKGSLEQIKLDELKRDAEASRQLYLTLLTRYKETQAQENLVGADARPLAYAEAPAKPSHPKSLLLLAAALVGSLGLGIGVAALGELTGRRLYSEAEVEEALNVPCLAEVPAIRLSRRKDANSGAGLIPRPGTWVEADGGRGREAFIQSIFAVLRWIDMLPIDGARVVAVVSADDGDGRSTLACQVARMAARSGVATLLADVDLRTQGLTRALALQPEGGGEASAAAEDLSQRVVQADGEAFHFLPAPADAADDPLDLFCSRALLRFLDAARDRYELVVLDTPALGAWADAGAVLDMADAAVVVLKAGETTLADAQALIRKVSGSAVTAAATVLNGVPQGRRSGRAARTAADARRRRRAAAAPVARSADGP